MGGHAVEGVCNNEEVVGSHGEELPVIGPWGPQHLVHLERLCTWVPPVDHTVNGVVVITWERDGEGTGEFMSVYGMTSKFKLMHFKRKNTVYSFTIKNQPSSVEKIYLFWFWPSLGLSSHSNHIHINAYLVCDWPQWGRCVCWYGKPPSLEHSASAGSGNAQTSFSCHSICK